MIKNKKDILTKIGWTLLMGLIGCLLVLSVQRKLNADVSNLHVVIKPLKGKRNLVNEKEVEKIFQTYLGYDVSKASIKDLDLSELEEMLRADKRIKRVEIFMDSKNRVNVWIVQKQPILRVVDDESFSYYLDEEGDQVPVKRGNAIRVPVATGFIDLYDKESLLGEKKTSLGEVFEVAKRIHGDEFLSALVEQIDVDSKRDINLIPKLGRQKVNIGGADDLDYKIYKLKMTYKHRLPKEGWSKYAVLYLNYEGQVVGRKM